MSDSDLLFGSIGLFIISVMIKVLWGQYRYQKYQDGIQERDRKRLESQARSAIWWQKYRRNPEEAFDWVNVGMPLDE